MADKDKEPHWANDPPPGFGPDGKSYIVDSVEELEKVLPKLKIKGPDDKLYTPEEWKDREDIQLDLDALSVEELEDLIAGLEESKGGQKSKKEE